MRTTRVGVQRVELVVATRVRVGFTALEEEGAAVHVVLVVEGAVELGGQSGEPPGGGAVLGRVEQGRDVERAWRHRGAVRGSLRLVGTSIGAGMAACGVGNGVAVDRWEVRGRGLAKVAKGGGAWAAKREVSHGTACMAISELFPEVAVVAR